MDGLSFAIGMILGVSLACLLVVGTNHYVPMSDLNAVGIERIEKCHNTHSNWCEIVWIKEAK